MPKKTKPHDPALKINATGIVSPQTEKEDAEFSSAFAEAEAISKQKDERERLQKEKEMLARLIPAGIKESIQKTKRLKEIDRELENLQAPKRPSQRHRLIARSVAAEIWRSYPQYTIELVANSRDIHSRLRSEKYSNRTIRNWIKDLAPNRLPGRRKAHS